MRLRGRLRFAATFSLQNVSRRTQSIASAFKDVSRAAITVRARYLQRGAFPAQMPKKQGVSCTRYTGRPHIGWSMRYPDGDSRPQTEG